MEKIKLLRALLDVTAAKLSDRLDLDVVTGIVGAVMAAATDPTRDNIDAACAMLLNEDGTAVRPGMFDRQKDAYVAEGLVFLLQDRPLWTA